MALEGGLKRQTVSVADLATFSLDLGTFGASAASYFHWKRVGNTGFGVLVESFLKSSVLLLVSQHYRP